MSNNQPIGLPTLEELVQKQAVDESAFRKTENDYERTGFFLIDDELFKRGRVVQDYLLSSADERLEEIHDKMLYLAELRFFADSDITDYASDAQFIECLDFLDALDEVCRMILSKNTLDDLMG